MGFLSRIKEAFGGRRKPPEPPPVQLPPRRRPSVEVAAKALRTWAPPPEIVEGPLTPLEAVMAAADRAVATAPPPPPPPPPPVATTPGGDRPRLAPGERVVHLVFEDGSMVRAEETSEAARLAYLGRNILDETKALSS